ncbi:MAG: MFS transporter [Arcanobacterium sp.]|nr:MFS transporter [Arcanobacterium sp.]
MNNQYLDIKTQNSLKIISVIMITLAAFEVVAVTTAMPYVVEELNGKHLYAIASGIVLASQLITCALAGTWCDNRGPLPVLFSGIGLFTFGLLIATFAPSIWPLIIGRAIQGFGAGLLIVPLYMMIGHYVQPERQPAFFAAFAAAWILPSLIGPVIAGFLVEHIHWRWAFGITPLLIAVVLPYMIRTLKKFPKIKLEPDNSDTKLLLIFAIISGLAVGALQLFSGQDATDMNLITVIAIITLSSISIFAVRPLLPAHTLRVKRGLPGTIAYRFIINGTYIAAELFLTLLLKEVHNFTPTKAGFVITVGSITWAIGSWLQGRIHNPKWRASFPYIGSIMQFFGTVLTLGALIPGVPGSFVFVGWLIASLGVGLVFPAMTVHALALTAKADQGKTSSGLSVADTLGSAFMVAYVGIIYAYTLSFGNLAFLYALGFNCIIMILGFFLAFRVNVEPETKQL